MSIIIQFNSSSFIQSAGVVPLNNSCCPKATVKLEMVPGIEHSDVPVMTDDEGSIVDIATSNSVFATTLKGAKNTHCCFGLPYQDHNYGAPPPPTPPTYSPCPSPAADIAIPDEDTNHSVISTTTTTEEAQEESITRCICGFEHDDEYMICCDNCLVWQHVDCMGLDRNNIPETYLCEKCEPRKLDRHKAKLLQARKKTSLISKLPSAKQEPCANNLIFGKNYKKKALLQNSLEWPKVDFPTMPPTSLAQRFYCTSDSDEDGGNKNTERRPKTRSKRRKREEEKLEQSSKRNKALNKHVKERMEMKRSKLRRTKNKESTSTADEEAQDAWQYSMEWCEENFESAVSNQYTPEVQQLARMISTQGYEKKFFEMLQTKKCHVLDDGKVKQLVCLYDLPRNQPLIEFKGKFLLASQFHDIHPLYNKRLYPFVLFYKLDQAEICVDASIYGNDARFVRRSCKPNAEIRHMVYNGNLHLYLQSTKVIFSEDEVTVPFNFSQGDNLKDMKCACGSDDCPLKPKKKNGIIEAIPERRRRSRRSTTISADDDSSQCSQSLTNNASPEKPKPSPIKSENSNSPVLPPETSDPVEIKGSSDHESEEQSNESKKKLTREERKIDAYVRAFVQLEKAERRRQQALERQKNQQPKSEDPGEKELGEKSDSTLSNPKEEEKPAVVSASESQCEEEVKATPPAPKVKKGKRRRGSGTPSRRRTRTNSGGSDILHLDETLLPNGQIPSTTTPNPEPVVVPAPSVPSTALPPPSSPTPPPVVPPAPSPIILKTKRFLLHEWLQEKSETSVSPPVSSPRSIRTEMKWNTSADSAMCYVRCTKDSPHSGGISAAHLRRSNSCQLRSVGGSGQGSAKKRWLRQAMNDCGGSEEQLSFDSSSMEHMDNGCLSPNSHGDVDSPGPSTEDILTPLKKRRLMRESVESAPSPRSPYVENSLDDTDGTSSSYVIETQFEQKIDPKDQQLLCSANDNSLPCYPKKEENSQGKINLRWELTTEIRDDAEANKEIKVSEVSLIPNADENCGLEKSNSEENTVCQDAEPCTEISGCDVKIKSETDLDVDSKENIPSVVQTDCVKSISSCEVEPISMDLKNLNQATPLEENTSTFTDLKVGDTEFIFPVNQSAVKVEEMDSIKNDDIAEKQSLNPCTVTDTSLSSVNNANLSKTDIDEPVDNTFTSTLADIKEEPTAIADHSGEEANLISATESSMQDNLEETSLSKESNSVADISSECETPCETIQAVNKPDNTNSTNDRSSNFSVVTQEQTTCSSASSCNSIVNSNSIVSSTESTDNADEEPVKTTEGADAVAQVQPILNEDSNIKPCALATQKRKVSLSEYRMRMRENNNKPRSNFEPAIKATSAATVSSTLPETLSEQVTLAPLPLFDTIDTSMTLTNKQTTGKKKEIFSTEDDDKPDIGEHRENLNERLKREFGFDVSEGLNKKSAGLVQSKLKGNNQTSSNYTVPNLLLGAQPLPPPPPPPPPPRPLRSPQTVIGAVTSPISPQYGFVHPSYPQSPYIVPQVPGAPYIPTQPSLVAPVIRPVHQMSTNSATCGVRPPLLPSAHSFTPSMPGTILRTTTQHDYAPVNAQRFATMVPQPPPLPQLTHKTYPHVYQSGLYK